MFPISPALSVVDSLDGIEDLDAFLEARGALSHFPTPPSAFSNKKAFFQCPECSPCLEPACSMNDRQRCNDFEYDIAALVLSQQVVLDRTSPSQEQVENVRQLLVRAAPPPETMAIAFNILSALRVRRTMPRSQVTRTASTTVWPQAYDRDVVAALEIAVSYTTDHPPQKSWWLRHVAQNAWPLAALHETIRNLLAALDWRLHTLSDQESIESALAMLNDKENTFAAAGFETASPQHLRLLIDDFGAAAGAEPSSALDVPSYRWEHGQITPDERYPSMHFNDAGFCPDKSAISPSQPMMERSLRLL